MFNDLTNNSLNPIYTQNVKSYPSINSPNSGGFNDEINMKWISKKFTSKPFVINPETDFTKNKQTATTLYINSGSVCVDGYMIKLSSAGSTSFDAETVGTIPLNIQYVNRFVSDLTGIGTSTPTKTAFADILFSDYNPGTVQDDDYSTINANWGAAKDGQTCTGYTMISYTGSYYDELTIDSGNVKYGNTSIPIKTYAGITYASTPDAIKSVVEADSMLGKPFAKQDMIAANTITIFYPLFYKMTFKDIFGFEFYLVRNTRDTKQYPYTGSDLIDAASNKPLTSISFSSCNLKTMPTNIYDFESIYDSNSERYTDPDDVSFSPVIDSITPQGRDIFADVLVIKTLSDLLVPAYVPAGQTNIEEIDNELSYYCLNIDTSETSTDPYKDELLEGYTNNSHIPVAFMTSNGKLCPNGFISQGTSTTYPVEGYLHFLKRMYRKKHDVNPTPTEAEIQSVTVQNICDTTVPEWTTWFTTFYSDRLSKVVCAYIHFAYCSLLDNVVNTSGSEVTDFKSIGCGIKLAEAGGASITAKEFTTEQAYTFNGYIYNSGTDTFDTNSTTQTIEYWNDKTSDYNKIETAIDWTTPISGLDNLPFLYYKNIDFSTAKSYLIAVEDPIALLKRLTGSNKISGIKLYKYDNSTNQMVQLTKKLDSGWNAGIINNLPLDDNLMPKIEAVTVGPILPIHLNTHQFGNYEHMSITTGLGLRFESYSWAMNVPAYVTIYKDGDNYLAGKDFINPNEYLGCKVGFNTLQEQDNNTVFLFNLVNPITNTNVYPDVESKFVEVDISSPSAKVNREAFIDIDRIYDKDSMQTLDEHIQDSITDVAADINSIMQAIYNLQQTSIKTLITYYDNPNIYIGRRSDPTKKSEPISPYGISALKISGYYTNSLGIQNSLTDYIVDIHQITDVPEAIWGSGNENPYNDSVSFDFYRTLADGVTNHDFGVVLIKNNSNTTIQNLLINLQVHGKRFYNSVTNQDYPITIQIDAHSYITLDETAITLAPSGTQTLTATTYPAGETVTWSSSDTSIATVNSSGEVAAVSSGTAIIYAELEYNYAKVRAGCVVTVS